MINSIKNIFTKNRILKNDLNFILDYLDDLDKLYTTDKLVKLTYNRYIIFIIKKLKIITDSLEVKTFSDNLEKIKNNHSKCYKNYNNNTSTLSREVYHYKLYKLTTRNIKVIINNMITTNIILNYTSDVHYLKKKNAIIGWCLAVLGIILTIILNKDKILPFL